MKIVVPTNGDNLDSEISKTFGRTQNFLAVDFDTLQFEIINNNALNPTTYLCSNATRNDVI